MSGARRVLLRIRACSRVQDKMPPGFLLRGRGIRTRRLPRQHLRTDSGLPAVPVADAEQSRQQRHHGLSMHRWPHWSTRWTLYAMRSGHVQIRAGRRGVRGVWSRIVQHLGRGHVMPCLRGGKIYAVFHGDTNWVHRLRSEWLWRVWGEQHVCVPYWRGCQAYCIQPAKWWVFDPKRIINVEFQRLCKELCKSAPGMCFLRRKSRFLHRRPDSFFGRVCLCSRVSGELHRPRYWSSVRIRGAAGRDEVHSAPYRRQVRTASCPCRW